MPERLPLVLVHGYSVSGAAFAPWVTALTSRGYDVTMVHVSTYRSLSNELTISDIAEGFDRALRIRAGLDDNEPFDAVVHSTGMLVLRAWLASYAERRDRLKHLIALAPATFGSPVAHKGRSWLGAVFKGNRELGPDFLEAGDRILEGLELASRYTWDLAHLDLLGEETFYGPTRTTPFVFTFCGTRGYSGLRGLLNVPGGDGVVRWAGCPLNVRKIVLDLTVDPARIDAPERVSIAPWTNVDVPLVPIDGINHGTILSAPSAQLVDLVDSALRVSSAAAFTAWVDNARKQTAAARRRLDEWQQFIVRVIDERGDPVTDYNVQLYGRARGVPERNLRAFATDVHVFRGDPSLRSFHVNLSKVNAAELESLLLRVIASSGSQLVGYTGFGSDRIGDTSSGTTREGKWDGSLDLSELLGDAAVSFFYPFTTTLVEIRINREPLPLVGRNEVFWF
ncbi:hypothetical protein BH23GEM2_BH23GEM2_12820 [soil metagenome]